MFLSFPSLMVASYSVPPSLVKTVYNDSDKLELDELVIETVLHNSFQLMSVTRLCVLPLNHLLHYAVSQSCHITNMIKNYP